MKIVVLFFTLFLTSTNWYANSTNFEKRIKSIHSKVVDLTDIFALHEVKEFNEVYDNPLKFKDTVLQYLKQPEDFTNKLIAICSMTKLPLDQYVDVVSSCYNLYQKKAINEDLLERCTFNEFDSKHIITKQYKNQKLQHLLIQMLKNKALSKQFKSSIKETLSGKSYADLKKAGQIN